MAKIVRPYKIQLKSWKILPTEPMYSESGRQILRIAIAELQEQDGTNHEYIYENIYKDILANIFVDKQDYKILNSHGKNPAILIVSDNDIIPHNPMVSELIQLVRDKLDLIDKTELRECFIEMINTRNNSQKKSKKEKDLYKKLNGNANKLSNDLIYYVLYDYIMDDIRSRDTRSFKEQLITLDELNRKALTAYYNNDTEALEKIKNDLLYRFLLQQIKTKEKGEA